VTEQLERVTTAMPDVDRSRFRLDVANEAYRVCLAMVDSDGRYSDDELWPVIMTFAPLLDDSSLARSTPSTLREGGIMAGAASYLNTPSDLFEILLAGDRRSADRGSGAGAAARYYERAMELVHAMAALDVLTTREELDAIARFRAALLGRIDMADVPAFPPAGTGAQSGIPQAGLGGPPPSPPAAAQGVAPAPTEPVAELPPPRPLEELMAELDALVGLGEVKVEIRQVTDLIRVNQLRQEHGLPVLERSNHLIFAGNPGTGKTTVARLLAQIYRTLGVVSRGQLIEVDRSSLVAGFVGQTAPLVASQFDKADQGILFIDEAYSLVRGGSNDFGKEAVDAIVKNVEDRRDDVVVIMAGYTEEMGELMEANPGLSSRFPKTIYFADYSVDELIQIFKGICAKNEYELDPPAEAKLRRVIEAVPRDRHFGNGRLVRNIFEAAVVRQASRLVGLKDPDTRALSTFTAADIPDVAPGHRPPSTGSVPSAIAAELA
jgi:NAD(P)-dependent dehydrogenase (short-subunit alcohol dehydrogenase family)